MKKILTALALIIIFTSACGNSKDINDILLSSEKLEKYDEAIGNLLAEYKWNYDKTSISYNVSLGMDTANEKYPEIKYASNQIGLDFSKYENDTFVDATASLLHFNGDSAGKAYFYIVNEKIVCAYYVYNSNIYSLDVQNVFARTGAFSGSENTDISSSFIENDIAFDYDDYVDISSSGSIAVIDDDYKLKICNVGDSLKVIKNVYFSNEFYPMDFRFTDSGAAVLLGKIDETYLNAGTGVDYEVEEENAHSAEELYKLKSWKIMFLDGKFRETNKEIPLDVSTYKTLNILGDAIFLTRDNTIDIFENQNGSYEKTYQISLKHDINMLRFADIDGSGSIEMIIIDGKDLYVYEYEDKSVRLLWNSHLSIESMEDSLYIADLNNDGISEIYIEDLSETTARYILGEKGFKTYGKGIEYGYKYILGDFNNDGITDYIKKNIQTQQSVLNISEGLVK